MANRQSTRAGVPLPSPSSHQQWAAWRSGELPQPELIAPHVWCIPVVIPNHPMRFTFSYAIAGTDGDLVLIDTGWPGDIAWQSLLAGLNFAGLSLARVKGVVVTHFHPDHHGLSARVSEATGAWIGMHTLDADDLISTRQLAPTHGNGGPGASAQQPSNVIEAGIPLSQIAEMTQHNGELASVFTSMVPPTLTFEDGDVIPLAGRSLRVVWTPGHTTGSICIHDEHNNILFTGDHVLPRISPNVGMHVGDGRKPLIDYLASLARIGKFDGAHVAPGHEYRFDGLMARITSLLAHHESRLVEVSEVLDAHGSLALWAISERLSWSRGWDGVPGAMKFAALAETHAHLQVLDARGMLLVVTRAGLPTLYSGLSRDSRTGEPQQGAYRDDSDSRDGGFHGTY